MTHTRWISCSFAAWLLAIGLTSAHPLSAQATPDTNAPAKAVSLPVTVLDKHGKIATNLSKDDFVLQEDGRFQDIGSIVPAGDLPLTIGLAVDTSLSQRSALGQERDASSNFLDQILRGDKDQAFLIHFDQEVELDQDVTSSREKLRAGLQSMQAPQFSQTSGDRDQDDQHRRGASSRRGGAMVYDAVYLASDEILKKQPGRKTIIVLSDGVDRDSKETLHAAIEAAQRADAVVYAVYFKSEQQSFGSDRGGYGPWGGPMGGHRGGGQRRYPQEQRPDGKKILEQITHETGGRVFEASGKETVGKIYTQIQEELRGQYSVSYTPDRVAAGAGFHKIELKAKKKDLTVETQVGYYGE